MNLDELAIPCVEMLREKGRQSLAPGDGLTRAEKRVRLQLATPDDVQRPTTRGECVDGPRPCPFVSCAHHLYLDVSRTGSLKLNFPHLEPDEIPETCSLDAADRGGLTLDEVGTRLGVTRERVRQVENIANRHLRAAMRRHGEKP